MHVTLESLLKDKELTKAIKDLVRGSGRSYPLSEEVESHVTVTQQICLVSEEQQIAVGQDKLPLANKRNGVPETKIIPVV